MSKRNPPYVWKAVGTHAYTGGATPHTDWRLWSDEARAFVARVTVIVNNTNPTVLVTTFRRSNGIHKPHTTTEVVSSFHILAVLRMVESRFGMGAKGQPGPCRSAVRHSAFCASRHPLPETRWRKAEKKLPIEQQGLHAYTHETNEYGNITHLTPYTPPVQPPRPPVPIFSLLYDCGNALSRGNRTDA